MDVNLGTWQIRIQTNLYFRLRQSRKPPRRQFRLNTERVASHPSSGREIKRLKCEKREVCGGNVRRQVKTCFFANDRVGDVEGKAARGRGGSRSKNLSQVSSLMFGDFISQVIFMEVLLARVVLSTEFTNLRSTKGQVLTEHRQYQGCYNKPGKRLNFNLKKKTWNVCMGKRGHLRGFKDKQATGSCRIIICLEAYDKTSNCDQTHFENCHTV